MKNRVFNGRVIFDHLPKTAGLAINSWLIRELGSGCVTPNLIGNHEELIQQYGGEYSIISGHMHFSGNGLDPRYQYVTFFRDPIERVISWLYFVVKNHTPNELGELYKWVMELIDSEGSVYHSGLDEHISNLYTSHFSKLIHDQSYTQVQNAIEAVKLYSVVGFYDEMPYFLADFASLLGLPAPETIAKVNVTKQKPATDEISPQLRERLIELNHLDIEFYEKLREWNSQREKTATPSISASPWKRYERLNKYREFINSDFQLHHVFLKEGYNIIYGQSLQFEIEFALNRHIEELEAGIHIWDTQQRWAFGVNSTLQKQILRNIAPGIYRLSHHVVANLPEAVYTAGFVFTERLPNETYNELLWYDKLCEFRVSHPTDRVGIGYANLPSTQTFTQITPIIKNIITNGMGKIVCETIPLKMTISESSKIDLEVFNNTEAIWKGDVFHPINISYHWLDIENNIVVFEGVRTPIPITGISPRKSELVSINILTPPQPNNYRLMLTMVQENSTWFENIGFQPLLIDMTIE